MPANQGVLNFLRDEGACSVFAVVHKLLESFQDSVDTYQDYRAWLLQSGLDRIAMSSELRQAQINGMGMPAIATILERLPEDQPVTIPSATLDLQAFERMMARHQI